MHLALLIAQDESEAGSNLLLSLLPFLVIGFIMYLLLIRPQRRKMREQANLQASIGVGDEVITTSGVYGFVTGEDEESGVFWLEIDDDVQIRIAKAAVQRRIDTVGDDDADDDDADDDGADTDVKPHKGPFES